MECETLVLNNELAYIIGLLSADGNVDKKYSCISLQLQHRDIDILRKIYNILLSYNMSVGLNEYSRSIICLDGKEHVYSRLRIYKREHIMFFVNHGIIPNKSSILTYPNIIDRYIWHYIRGYYDGNGSIHKRRNCLEMTINSGSKVFLEELSNRLSVLLNISNKNINMHSGVYRYTLYSSECMAFLQNIYHDSNDLYIQRKYDVYNNYIKTPHERWWTEDELTYLKTNYIHGEKYILKKLSSNMKRSVKSINSKLWRLGLRSQ